MGFEGKVAAVTGGASGIGAACCRMLAARGAKVAVTDRDLARAEALAAEIGGLALPLDVATQAANEAAAAEVEAALGPVEILVTSAGVLQRPLRAEALPEEDIRRVVDIDQIGTYLSAVAFGSRMARRGRGSIVTIASISGSRGLPLHAYAPAKAAVIAMTRGLAGEWGRSGVRVNSVSPGFTMTPAMAAAIEVGERDPALLEETSALGRMITTEDVAEAVCFLASEAARAITGIDLPVDAGWLVAPSWASYGGVPPARANAG
ncbi:SDR family oxidoreductase [Roseococcus sp. SYP-B2431]|uniref:SDR family NAD(P)-dependent oxidoreductase n=1 Tax=Roseococcus sp. SYP-B2431 TaxID=2496640 RepID=UPI00103A688A|nr:SDR family oxidoreductase [Roseococcus sp. SYP-B2431]TCH99706.1 SDR family oxidoreductase [Roseococcus sp. SYP-B2431]